ncbi:MAG TPA: HD domain-containing protein [Longimicrobiales bacterium]|nr:HD domain-containing protein [Longimicrobiales bacterium]
MTDIQKSTADQPVEPPVGRTVAERFERRVEMNVPGRGNPRLTEFIERVNADDDLYGLWLASNVTAIERLGMTDHGPVHVKIVMNIAAKLYRMLESGGVEPGVVHNWGLDILDGELVVVAAALLHDIGMSIHRSDHESYSLFLAHDKLKELLAGIYEARTATVMRSEILHAIIAHRSGGKPLTMEAGVVRVADALDMAKGRSRVPFSAGSSSIHSISAAAIEAVHLERGEIKPVKLRIEMSNSVGVFQLDQLFREKLSGSGLEAHIELEANIEGNEEKSLVREFRI